MSNKQNTRDRLIEAARQLFLEKGYTATGVAEILQKAGLNAGSLYHFFATKEDLLLAVLERYKQLLDPLVLEPVFGRISDPMERVFGILAGYRQMLLQTDHEQGCPIGNLALELSTTHPAARRVIAENFTGWRNAVANCLRQASGRLPAGLDTDQLALFVLTLMEGAVMLARAYRSIDVYDAAVAQLRDYIDRLLSEGTNWSAPRPSPRASRQVKRMRRNGSGKAR
jgi:AcrR family transcriptional regulator